MAQGTTAAMVATETADYSPEKTRRRGFRSALERWRATVGFSLAALLVWVGWLGRADSPISAGEGIGYWLGVIGGTLMLALLLYSVRKRIPLLRHLGATRHWFRMHMTLGIVGPIIILFHSNFQLGSINSQVALFCTLLVAASGIVGRYFYVQIHNGLYGSSASLRQLIRTLGESDQKSHTGPGISRAIDEQLAALAETVLKRPETLGTSALSPVWLGFRTRRMYGRLKRDAYLHIDQQAENSPLLKQHRSRLRRATRHYLRNRLAEIRKVAQFSFYEKLFSLWHIVHVPFFLLMVLSALLHVVAVHMY
jgi:hypothetical protein